MSWLLFSQRTQGIVWDIIAVYQDIGENPSRELHRVSMLAKKEAKLQQLQWGLAEWRLIYQQLQSVGDNTLGLWKRTLALQLFFQDKKDMFIWWTYFSEVYIAKKCRYCSRKPDAKCSLKGVEEYMNKQLPLISSSTGCDVNMEYSSAQNPLWTVDGNFLWKIIDNENSVAMHVFEWIKNRVKKEKKGFILQ